MGEIVRAFPAGQQVDTRPVVQMREAREARAPLADLDAERAVLGACLLDSDRQGHMLEALSKRLRASDFFREQHRAIYAALLAVWQRGEGVDTVSVSLQLRADRVLNAVGGPQELSDLAEELAQGIATLAHFETHAGIVAQMAARRRMADFGAALQYRARDLTTSLIDVRNGAAKALMELHIPGAPAATLGDDLEGMWDQSERVERGEVTYHLPSGVRGLDRILDGGFAPGKVYLLAARPRVGKTALAVQVGLEVARRGRGVYMLSLEIAARDLARQAVGCLGGVDYTHIASGRLTDEERAAAIHASNELSRMPFYRADLRTPGCPRTVAGLAAALHGLPTPPALVIVDHVGKLKPRGKFYRDRRDALAEVSADLIELARTTGVVLLVLAHISRDGADRPTLEDLSGADDLGKDADGVILMHRPDLVAPEPKKGKGRKSDPDAEELAKPEVGVALVAVAKLRGGPVNAVCRMRLRGEFQRWDPMDCDADEFLPAFDGEGWS